MSELSSFLTASQHILGYLVPNDGVEDAVKERGYNKGHLAATITRNDKY